MKITARLHTVIMSTVLLSWSWVCSISNSQPVARFQYTETDVGEIHPTSRTLVAFPCANDGNQDLELRVGKKSCSCVLSDSSRGITVPPNTSRNMSIAIDTRSTSGSLNFYVEARTNDPNVPSQVLHIRANTKRVLFIRPPAILTTIDYGATLEVTCQVDVLDSSFRVLSASSHDDTILADVVQQTQPTAPLEMRVWSCKQITRDTPSTITVRYAKPSEQPLEVSIPVFITTRKPLACFPRALVFSLLQGNSGLSRDVTIVPTMQKTQPTFVGVSLGEGKLADCFSVSVDATMYERSHALRITLQPRTEENRQPMRGMVRLVFRLYGSASFYELPIAAILK
jgi:hypothetical protein